MINHSAFFLILSCIAIGPLLVTNAFSLDPIFILPWTAWMLVYLFRFSGLTLRIFVICLLISLMLNIPMVLSPLFFSANDVGPSLVLRNYLRLCSFSLLSLCCARCFDFSQFLYFLMSRGLLSATLGHTFLLAFNSFARVAQEWSLLRLIGRNRGRTQPAGLMFPFMVFTIRNAERGALGLQSRGISDGKTFCFDYAIRPKDWAVLAFFILGFGLVAACFGI